MVYDDLLSDLCYYNEYKENSSHHREAAILLINFSLCSGYAANTHPDINGSGSCRSVLFIQQQFDRFASFISGFLFGCRSEECVQLINRQTSFRFETIG